MTEPIKPEGVLAALWPELADDFRAYQDSLMRGEKAPQAEKVLIAAVATQAREMIASALDEAGESIHASSPDTQIAIARHATFEMAAGIAHQIRQRAEAAHKGPWLTSETTVEGIDYPVVYVPHDEHAEGAATVLFEADWGEMADAEFIAHARTDVPRLLAVADAVLAQHRRSAFPVSRGEHRGRAYCLACTTSIDDQTAYAVWPCPTIQTIARVLAGEVSCRG